MAQLRRQHKEFIDRNTAVVVAGPNNAAAFADYFGKHKLPFYGLPDPKYAVLKLYGQEIKLFKFGRMPAQVLIDSAGIARFVHYGKDMSDIPPTEELLALIDGLLSREG